LVEIGKEDVKAAAKAAKEAEKEAAKAAKEAEKAAAEAAKVAENVKNAKLASHANKVHEMEKDIDKLQRKRDKLNEEFEAREKKLKILPITIKYLQALVDADPTEEDKKKEISTLKRELTILNSTGDEPAKELSSADGALEDAKHDLKEYKKTNIAKDDLGYVETEVKKLKETPVTTKKTKAPKPSVDAETKSGESGETSTPKPPKSAAKSSRSKQPKKDLKPVSAFEQLVSDLLRIGDFPSDKMMSNAKDMKKKIWNNTKKRLQNISVNKEHPNVDYTSIFNAMDSKDNIIEKLKKSEKPDGEMFNNLPMDVPAKLPNASVKSGEEWITFFTNVWENLTPPAIDE
jgi:histone H1/5